MYSNYFSNNRLCPRQCVLIMNPGQTSDQERVPWMLLSFFTMLNMFLLKITLTFNWDNCTSLVLIF